MGKKTSYGAANRAAVFGSVKGPSPECPARRSLSMTFDPVESREPSP
jgi:hypothetical protein